MDQVTLSIDGQQVTVAKDRSLLEAATQAGIRIPTLCHHPSLESLGACRICVVEDQKRQALVAACVTPVCEGLCVLTSSARVVTARREILNLIMASHPESCIVCDQGNRCELRSLASEMDLGRIDLYRIPYLSEAPDRNPILMRDMAKCVMCGRCVRADHEVVVRGALDYRQRGFETRPAPLLDRGLEEGDCTLCGTCESVCPTGAIYELERPFIQHGTQRTATVCWLCGCGCAVKAASYQDTLVGIEPDLGRDRAGVALCVRGHYGYDHVHSSDRLKTPLVRREQKLVQVSWNEALDVAVDGFLDIARTRGPVSMGVIGGSRGTVEEAYLLQRLARVGLATANLDSGARLDAAFALESLAEAKRFPHTATTLADLERAEVILLLGADPDVEAPTVAYAIRRVLRRGGCRLVAIGPVRPHLTKLGAQWIPLAGTSLAGVAAALVCHLLEQDPPVSSWQSSEIPQDLYEQAQAFRAWALPSQPGEPGSQKGQNSQLLAIQVAELAQALLQTRHGIVICGQQLAGSPAAKAATRWLVNLALLSGADCLALGSDPNTRGAIEMGLSPRLLPGGVRTDSEQAAHFAKAWGTKPPASPGLSYVEMIKAAQEDRLEGLLLVGENPIRALPGTTEVLQALRALRHLVVVDTYLGETAQEASVVLPAAAAAERLGTLVNFEGRRQHLAQVVSPPGEARPESWILSEMSRRLGAVPATQPAYLESEIASFVPKVETTCLLSVPTPKVDLQSSEAVVQGAMTLVVTASAVHAGSQTRTCRSSRLRKLESVGCLRLHPKDVLDAGLAGQEQVLVEFGAKQLVVPFTTDRAIPKGVAAISTSPLVWDFLPLHSEPSGAVLRTFFGVTLRALTP